MSGGEQVSGTNGRDGRAAGSRGGAAQTESEAVSALAREIEELRRAVRPLSGLRAEVSALAGRLDQLGVTVADAVDQLAAAGQRKEPVRPVSWIADPVAERAPDHPDYDPEACDPEVVGRRLVQLCEWVARVYVLYRPGGRELPACWLWHPEIVEELAWLMQAWTAAYDPEAGTVAAVADWHDRWRPGVAARIKAATKAAGSCSLHEHTGDDRPGGLPLPPPAGSAAAIARWWTTARDQQPPAPTDEDMAHAARRLRESSR